MSGSHLQTLALHVPKTGTIGSGELENRQTSVDILAFRLLAYPKENPVPLLLVVSEYLNRADCMHTSVSNLRHLLQKERINFSSSLLKSRLRTSARLRVEWPRAGLRDHDRVADLIVARRSIDRSAIRENLIF